MWTIQGETGKAMDATVRTLAAAGVEAPVLTFRNLGTDELTWKITLAGLAPDAEIIPEAGQKVTLFRNGTRFFSGHATHPKQRGHEVSVSVKGPWWWLERVFLESLQTDGTGATGNRATYAFASQSLTTSLDALLDAAIALGVPISVGTLATTFTAPEIRLNQQSFAAAIAEVCRITPDLAFWWDYSGSTPAANTSRRKTGLATGSAVSLDLAAGDLEDFDVNAVTETEVSQVKIPYLTRAANGAKQFATQSAGTAATGKVQILTVSGEEMDTFLPQDLLDSVVVKSATWSTAPLAQYDPTIRALVDQYGGFKAGTLEYFGNALTYWTGMSNNRSPVTVPFPPLTARAKTGATIPAGTQYLVTSTDPLPDWAVEELGAVEVDITGTLIAIEPAGGFSPLFAAMRQGSSTGGPTWMAQTGPETYYWLGHPLQISGWLIPTAYASNTTIYRPADYGFVAPPSGFADGLLAAQNFIGHSGTLTIMEDECGATRYLSRAINLTGAVATFATMRAMLASEELDLATGTTTLELGPPARFSYADLVNRLRSNSNSNIVYL